MKDTKNKVESLAKEFARKNNRKPTVSEIKKQLGYSTLQNGYPLSWLSSGVSKKLFSRKKIPCTKSQAAEELFKKNKKLIQKGVPIKKIWFDNQPTSFSLPTFHLISKKNLTKKK